MGHSAKGIQKPLAEKILEAIPSDYGVLVIPVAYGGIGFTVGSDGTAESAYDSTNRRPKNMATAYKWGKDSAYYKTLVDNIKWALDLNPENKFLGVVWIQGEAEGELNKVQEHKTGFEEMTTKFFEDMNGYADRTYHKKMDNDIWFNMETVSYWYTTTEQKDGVGVAKSVGSKAIWENYKTWNEKTYVVISREAPANTTGFISSIPECHFGHNAYRDYCAPAVFAKMQENGVFTGLFAE